MGKFIEAFKRRKNRNDDYKSTFTSQAGERVLNDLFRFCGVFTSSFSKDPYETALKEGQRNVALKIIHELNLTPSQFEAMSKRASQLEENNDW